MPNNILSFRFFNSKLGFAVYFFFLIFIPTMLGAIGQEPHHITAFIPASGEIDTLLTYSTYSTDSFWNHDGKNLPTYNHFDKRSYLLYLEYAFNRCNSLSLNGGYSTVKESLNGNSRAVEDFELGWKFLFKGTSVSALTTQVIGIIPAGDKKSSIRYGKAGLQAGLLYSYLFKLGKRTAWYDLELAYLYYRGEVSDQIRANLAIGYGYYSPVTLIAATQLIYGLFNGDSHYNLNNVSFYPNYRLLKMQLECVAKPFPCVFLSLGVYKHVWGQNIGRGGGYYAGIWIDF